jgi:DNA-binding response OmpR family regulator
VRTAGTGYDAGLLTESFRPHLMILDYMLPDVNGNIVCQRLRERDDMADCKVLCVSGVVNQQEIQGLMDAGADDFVKKPFDIDDLMGRIEALLELESEPHGASS